MRTSQPLLLPGEASGPRTLALSGSLVAVVVGLFWLPVRSTLVPALGLDGLPFDPLLPLVAAFALGGRRAEAWGLALVLGYLGDLATGFPSGRIMLQYALVACLATPLHGRVVLRDRGLPVLGVTVLAFVSGLGVLLTLGAMGATLPNEASRLPAECFGTGAAAFLLWPAYRRVAGWKDERRMSMDAES